MPLVIHKKNYVVIGIVAVSILSVLVYSFFISHIMINKYSPLVDATMEIKFETTTAHLWLEEKISGDRYENVEDIIDHVDQAIWYATAMLDGGENPEGRFFPLKDPALRQGVSKALELLNRFKQDSLERFRAVETSGIGTPADQRYDRSFKRLLKHVDAVETLLQKKIKTDYANYRIIQILMMGVVVCTGVFLFVVQYRHDRDLQKAFLELKAARDKARQSENWLKTTMNSMGDAVIITDHNGQISYMNPVASSLTGWLLKQARGKNITEVFHIVNEVTKAPVVNPVNEVIKRNVVIGLANHTELISKTGEVWPISDSAAPIFDLENNLKGVVIVFHEVTAQKQAEQEKKNLEAHLRQASKMEAIGTLAGGIAHDFNNILAMIMGNAELAMEDTPAHSRAKSRIEKIFKASLRAKNLVQQILSFSRREEIKKEPNSLTRMVRDSIKMLNQTIPASVEQVLLIDQNLRSEENDVVIISDPTQIHQLMLNLCVNAVQAMDEKGTLTVGLERVVLEEQMIFGQTIITPGTYGHLSVSDTGPGIETDISNRIFDPFFTTKDIGQGTGMGLSVVHGIVESHGGEVFVDSKPGKGAVFHIYFPVTDQKQGSTAEDYGHGTGGNEHILLVDDEPMLLDIGKNMLERHGYKVTTETESLAALEKIKANPLRFDLVITDQTMPGLTGIELLEKLMKISPALPVVICTGHSSKIDRPAARKLGVRAFVTKPFESHEILTRIRKVFDTPRM